MDQTTSTDRIKKSFPCSWSILQVCQGGFTGLLWKAFPVFLVQNYLCICYSEITEKAYEYLCGIPTFWYITQSSINTTFWGKPISPFSSKSQDSSAGTSLTLSMSFPQLQFSYSFELSLLGLHPFQQLGSKTGCVQYLTGNHTNNPGLLYVVLGMKTVLFERPT